VKIEGDASTLQVQRSTAWPVMIFRALVEADLKEDQKRLTFGFCKVPHSEPIEWIGSLYVSAQSKEEVVSKITDFLEGHVLQWSFDGEPEPVDIKKWSLEWEAIQARGDEEALESGSVVVGWGF
jgi:hypothetical protein